MKLTFVLRNKQNALKLSTKTIESFIERIKTDTKDGAVARRRHELNLFNHVISYDNLHPSHQIYPSVEFERDANDNLRMRAFNGVVALTIDNLQTENEIDERKAELEDPANASDYMKLQDIQNEIDALEEKLLELMTEWSL